MNTARDEFRAAFVSLKIPEYRTLWWAGVFSFMSVQMQFVLRGILAWDLTRREGALGLVYFFFGLSMLIATPFGGVAADRFPRRTTLLVTQSMIFAGAALMGLAVVTDLIQFWMVVVAGVIQGVAFGFYGPARVAFAADLVGREQLGNAITLSLLSMSGTRVIAPSLAGVLAGVAFFGVGGAYLISSLFSFCSLVAIWRLPSIPIDNPSTRRPVADIKLGVQYVRANPSLRRLVVASVAIIMFGFNYVAFLPAMVKDVFGLDGDQGNAWIGLLSMASAIGAVAVSIPLASRADGARAKWLMAMSGFLFGGSVIALAATPGIWLAFAVIIVIGAATTTYQSLSNTLALQMTETAFQGRVQSIMQLSFAAFGMMALPLGVLAEFITLRWTIAVMGGVAVAASAIYWSLEMVSKSDKEPLADEEPLVDDEPLADDEPQVTVAEPAVPPSAGSPMPPVRTR